MNRAMWNGKVIAQSDATVIVEGNVYFPPDAIDSDCIRPSAATTVCGWKGTANYFDVLVDGGVNSQAAWYYANPKPEAENIRGYVAFWKGVEVK